MEEKRTQSPSDPFPKRQKPDPEEEAKMLKGTADPEHYDEWKAKEEAFHIEQAKLRSEIRIKEGREKPVDSCSKVYLILDGTLPVPPDIVSKLEYREPYLMFEGLSPESLKELQGDLELHKKFRADIDYANYWTSLQTLCKFYMDYGSSFRKGGSLSEHKVYKDGIDDVCGEGIKLD